MSAPSLWRNRDFTLLWASQTLSDTGSAITSLAYPLLILALTGSAVAAGAVGTTALVVRTALQLPAGVLVDRVNRRRLMIGCDVVRLVAFVVLGAAVLSGHASLPLIVAVAVVEAACSAAFQSAEPAALRNLVPLAQVSAAVARNEARNAAVSLAGGPLGGLLYAAGRAVPFLADAVSYALSLAGLLAIRRPFQQGAAGKPTTSPLSDLLEGLRFLFTDSFLRATLMIGAWINFAINGTIFGLILLLQRNGTPPPLIGLVETAIGVGALIGSILAGTLIRKVRGTILIYTLCLAGMPLLAAILPLSSSPAAGVPLAVLVLVSPATNATLFGYLAAVTPDRLLGRVNGALMTAVLSLTALAPLAAGLLVRQLGATGMVLGFTAAYAVGAVVALTARGIRTMRPLSEVTAEKEADAPVG
ncbi:MFS transporter [Actinocatenispora rupis]|uniref:MFS transporter n=1 Tax=Actinocatenispora rupis TaxID=519421 RepID=A0A8J3JB63_9ACTN|nr:MFS transporter [Actinocatenispora rupis]GID15235.1 MFS transporter [Actinocatenispora rupis]